MSLNDDATAARRIVAAGAAQLCDLATYAPLRASLLAINIPESSGKKAQLAVDRIRYAIDRAQKTLRNPLTLLFQRFLTLSHPWTLCAVLWSLGVFSIHCYRLEGAFLKFLKNETM